MNRKTMTSEVFVGTLAVVFGISSWVEINGLWVELPLLVAALPESWSLASYLVIVTQIANIGPLAYGLFRRFCPEKCPEQPMIHVTLLLGTTCCLLLHFYWKQTTFVDGKEHSVSLLTLAMLLAVVDCTSSVLYLPFMSRFKKAFLLPYIIGEGLSGLLPGLVALGQGVGGNGECRNVSKVVNDTNGGNRTEWKLVTHYPQPRFSVETFFLVLFAMMVASWIAFVLLNYHPTAKKYTLTCKENVVPSKTSKITSEKETYTSHSENVFLRDSTVGNPTFNSTSNIVEESKAGSKNGDDEEEESNLSGIKRSSYVYLLFLQAFICSLTNGALPAVQSYSCLPYGNVPFHLATTLSLIANPISCFVAVFLQVDRIRWVTFWTVVASAFASYLMATAAMSPTPPLVGTIAGSAILVVSWILFVSFFSYAKASIATLLRVHGGRTGLFHCGVATQIGSALGAILLFFLVNYAQVFAQFDACSGVS